MGVVGSADQLACRCVSDGKVQCTIMIADLLADHEPLVRDQAENRPSGGRLVYAPPDGKRWEVQMPPCNVTLCPVTSRTFPSILGAEEKKSNGVPLLQN